MSDMECPYCGAGQEVCHDDGAGYAEAELHQHQCSECEKYFVFNTSISFYYDPKKADCLNDGQHTFKATTTIPIEYTRMECTQCDERRDPTEDEMKEIMRKD